MRNRRLHDSLRAFCLDAARSLSAELEAGAEVEFALDEQATGRSVLYRYRPLVASFVGDRWQQLRTLESFGDAAEQLGTGSAAYLRVQGLAAEADPEPALLALLERIWEDATSFAFPEERFERVYAEVERALYEGVLQYSIVAPVPGLVMEHDRVEIGEGMVLLRGDLSGAPAEAVWAPGTSGPVERRTPYVVALLAGELPADAALPLPEARWRLRRLVTALRLWRAGSVALPATGWARADDGPWHQVELEPAPPARGGGWLLRAEEEDGFRQFAALVADWEPRGSLGWALARFDMGCERTRDAEAMSDYLLALRGLLDAADEAGHPTLARRLAALCAEEANRPLLMARVEAAVHLELALMGGVPIDVWSPPPGVLSGRDLVMEVEEHLRALLRDVACGYLKPDLPATADEIIYRGDASSQPAPLAPPEGEPSVTRTGGVTPRQAGDEQSVAAGPEPVTRLVDIIQAAPEPAPSRDPELRVPAEWLPEPERRAPEPDPDPPTASADLRPTGPGGYEQPALVIDDFAWDVGDAEDYSAPV
jgi:hypothetical protein